MLDWRNHHNSHKISLKPNFLYFLFKSTATLAVLFLFAGCTNDLEKVKLEFSGPEVPTAITRNVEIWYSDSGVVKFILKAPLRLDYRGENPYSEMPEGVEIRFSNPGDTAFTVLTARYALLKDKEGLLLTRGDVKILNPGGEEMTTQQLTWDDKNKVIFTDDAVFIKSEEQTITGEGMWALQDFSKYRILIPEGVVNQKEE